MSIKSVAWLQGASALKKKKKKDTEDTEVCKRTDIATHFTAEGKQIREKRAAL